MSVNKEQNKTNNKIIDAKKESEEASFDVSERWRIMKNVMMLGVAFMVHFTGYQGAANLQSSINAEAGLGTASLASVYVSLLLSNVFLPVLIIQWLGCKWTVAVSFIAYMPFIAAQCWPQFYTLIPAGLSVGLGGGPLWCAKCMYLTVLSEAYSKISGIATEVLVVRFFGVFYMICPLSQVWGNLISSIVLSSGNNTQAVTSLNSSEISELCGANFLAKEDAGEALQNQPPEKIRLIAGIYLACMVAACLIVAMGVDSMKRYSKDRSGSGSGLYGVALLSVSLKLLKEPDQLLILPITVWLGLGQVFMGADFTSSFVSCALGTGFVGYVMISYGLATCFSAVLTGCIVKFTGRAPVMLFGTVLQITILVTLLLWRPHPDQTVLFFCMAFMWGVCDGIFLIQINAFCGILFPGREEAAYSNFRLWESVGFIAAYVYSPYLRTSAKLYILLVTLLLGVTLYLIVEYRRRRFRSVDFKMEVVEGEKGVDNIAFQKSE